MKIKTPEELFATKRLFIKDGVEWVTLKSAVEIAEAYADQFEISDEEIFEYALLNWHADTVDFVDACQWYRDELKRMRNEKYR